MYKEEIQEHKFHNTILFAIYEDNEKKTLIKHEYYRPDNNILWREDIYYNESSTYYNYIEGWDCKNEAKRPKLEALTLFKIITYYPSGAISYVHNMKTDIVINYHENGQIKNKRFLKRFHTTKMNGMHSQVGTLDGKLYEYYETGIIKEIRNYVEGSKEGLQEYFDEEGRKIKEEIFEDNKLIKTRTF